MANAFTAKAPLLCPLCTGELVVHQQPAEKPNHFLVTFFCPRCDLGAQTEFFRFDPRDLIFPPYVACPKCGQIEYGVYAVHGNRFTRQCRNGECRFGATILLPRLRKTVVYLDQHIISDMMKALHPSTPAARLARVAYAREVFEVLDRAVQLQVVVCPDSHIHTNESMVAPDFKALERMYERLSGGVTFREVWDIKIRQVEEHARAWLHRQAPSFDLQAQRVVSGDLHGWQEVLQIGMEYRPAAETIAEVRKRREDTHMGMMTAYPRWASMSGTSFNVLWAEKIAAFAVNVAEDWKRYWETRRAIDEGRATWEALDLGPPLGVELVEAVRRAFLREGLDRDGAMSKAGAYFLNAEHSEIPYVRLDALLTATVAWQFANGRKTIGRGTSNDLGVIVHFLPYCDAMYVDGEMRGLLRDPRVSRGLGCRAQIFSRKTCDAFVAFIQERIASASEHHLSLVRAVYGERAGEPFTGLYADPRRP